MIRTAKPSVKFENQVSDWVQPPLFLNVSGEVTSGRGLTPIGIARFPAKVTGVAISGKMGKDDSSALSVAAQVYINGVAVCDTKPKIAHTSGEAAQWMSTQGYGEDDTGITVAVLGSNTSAEIGDVIACDLTLVKTSPTTNIENVAVIVELTPDFPYRA